MVRAEAHLRDGGLAEFNLPDSSIQKVERLRQDEYSEREIIHQLLTDDWAAPPLYVELIQHAGTPQAVRIRLRY